MDDIFRDIFGDNIHSMPGYGPDPDPKDVTPNQARSIIYVKLMRLSRAMTKYGELLEKNTPKKRPQ